MLNGYWIPLDRTIEVKAFMNLGKMSLDYREKGNYSTKIHKIYCSKWARISRRGINYTNKQIRSKFYIHKMTETNV